MKRETEVAKAGGTVLWIENPFQILGSDWKERGALGNRSRQKQVGLYRDKQVKGRERENPDYYHYSYYYYYFNLLKIYAMSWELNYLGWID